MRPLLAALSLCLLLAHLAYVQADHECGHVPPQRVGYSATASSRARRQATGRQPIRIQPVFYDEDFDQLPPDQRTRYKSVAERAIQFLSSFLRVDRLTQNITLQRFCNYSTPPPIDALNPYDHCTPDEPCQAPYCAFPEYPIRPEHVKACKTCESFGSTNCSTEGEDGPGVAADLVIYVAARSFSCNPNALAYATFCYLNMNTDRPIAGVVNLCPHLANESDTDTIVLTVEHELTHAMAFSPRLMPFYRDENGVPRTPRNATTGLPNPESSPIIPGATYQPSRNTVFQETVQRTAQNGVYNITVTKVVTPAVLREARRHFDCPTLNGMELENLGGGGTRLTHWKKRLIENEGMTGVVAANGVFSRLTFALYEDSGWYDVDYSIASPLRVGRCAGCDFAQQSCFSYGLNRQPFCNAEEVLTYRALGREGGANTSCTFDRVAVAACDLVALDRLTFNLSIPIQYKYFPDPNLAGTQETIDYCPTHTVRLHCQQTRDLGNNVFMESVGTNSKCVDFEIRTSWEYNNSALPPIYGGACYEVSCATKDSVSITVRGNTILCQSAGQEITVQSMGIDIVIICPAFEDICWENSTTCSATTSAPPSGLSNSGDIAIGVIFGLLFPLAVGIAVAVLVVLLVMHNRRTGGKDLNMPKPQAPADGLEPYNPTSTDLTLEHKT